MEGHKVGHLLRTNGHQPYRGKGLNNVLCLPNHTKSSLPGL